MGTYYDTMITKYGVEGIPMRITNVRIHPTWKVTEHPVESGGVVSDFVVRMPQRVTVSGYMSQLQLDYLQAIGVKRQVITTITVGSQKYENMAFTGCPYTFSTEKLGVLGVELQFTQITYANKEQKTYSPDDARAR